MINVDITSDLNIAMKDLDDFFWQEVPFAMAQTLNDVAFQSQKRIVNSTYPKAFTVRNKRFPGVMFKVTRDGSTNRAGLLYRMRDEMRYGGRTYLELSSRIPRANMRLHSTGGVRRGEDGHDISIPVNIKRTATGRIPKPKTATRMRDKKNVFVAPGRGGNRLVLERLRNKKVRLRHVLTRSAPIKKSFRFNEDALDTALRVFSGSFSTRFNRIVSKSRFR